VPAAKCQLLLHRPICVGNLYAIGTVPLTIELENGCVSPFSGFGTAIATLMPSTWFHANEGAAEAVLWSG
jgi:hypothetical protein